MLLLFEQKYFKRTVESPQLGGNFLKDNISTNTYLLKKQEAKVFS